MDPLTISAIIAGGSSVAGSLLNSSSAQAIASANIQNQLLFAEHGLTWKARDATRAQADTGINRLALLGVPTSSFQNVGGDSTLGSGVAAAGQDISRAIAAGASRDERMQQLEQQLAEAKIANVNADTARMLAAASQATRAGAPGTPPPIPTPKPNPLRTNWDIYYAKPTSQFYVSPTGGLISAPTADLSQAFQNWGSLPAQAAYAGYNIYENLKNAFGDLYPEGANWMPLRADAWRGVDERQYSPF